MSKALSLFLITSLFSFSLFGQSTPILNAQKSSDQIANEQLLSKQFKQYKIVTLEADVLLDQLSSFNSVENFSLQVDETESWPLQLVPEHHLVESMKIHTATGEDLSQDIKVFPYSGHVMNSTNSEARLTVAKNFIYGYIGIEKDLRFIEPLRHIIDDVASDLYIIYNGNDIIFPEGQLCASTSLNKQTKSMNSNASNSNKMSPTGLCFEVEVSTASDFLMYQSKGSSEANVTSHNVGVMNNVQGNYDDEFDDEILFVLVEQWISNCSTCDPWTSSTNSSTLLNSFTTWGPSGFDEVHDIGQIWTDRDFDGTTIGVAWVGAVCTNNRYQALEDFSNNAGFKRVMVAHETGHNFDANHDASGSSFIMAPSVSNSTTWSTASINAIEAHYNSRNCLANCAPPAPPVSDFHANLTDICPGTTIQFFDNSTSSPTSWFWSFPGGTPNTSTMQNPTVTYSGSGVFGVTMTATNASGSNTETKVGYITVSGSGKEIVLSDDFSAGLSNWTVDNPDGSFTWETKAVLGSSGNASVAWINNYDYQNGSGDLDGLESQVLDFTGRNNINLELEYAYARYNSTNSDIFRIKVSTNGGATFPFTIFTGQENGSGNFASVPDQSTDFEPADASEWCISTNYGPNCISLDLSTYTDESNVVILLENESDYGNNLYLDNIVISSDCQVVAPPVTAFVANVTSGCAPLAVQFQDLSTNAPSQWSWSFPGGTPANSSLQNPSVVYQTAGNYDVTLVATNGAGSNSFFASNYIEILDVPTASYSSVEDGNTVYFSNTSTGETYYDWDFGDMEGSTEENPVHVYDEDGSYVVILTVGNACGTNTFINTVEVSTAPMAGFSASTVEGCAPLLVSFINSSSVNTDSYLWTFEGGSPSSSTAENPTVQYFTKGVYDVTLEVTNEAGQDQLVMTDHITVNDVPETDFSSFVDGFDVDFTNLTIDGTSYSWDFGDTNESAEESPSHTYLTDGEFTVVLTATNSCGMHTLSETILISNAPNAGASANATAGCADFVVQFQDNSSSNVTAWLWTFEGGEPASSNLQNPVVTYNSAGVYDVSLTVTNNEGNDNVILLDYITVEEQPTADFSFTKDQLTYDFANNSTNGTSYLWDFGDTNTSMTENPTHTYDEDGMYTVILTVTNGCGNTQYSSIVNVVSQVVAGFNSNVNSGCADLQVQYFDTSTDNATTWQWSFPGGTPSTSTEQSPFVIYQESGSYDATLIASNSEYSDEYSFTNYISVTDVPESGFSFDVAELIVTFENTTINGVTYMWDFGDDDMSPAEDPVHVFDSEGIYSVMLIATNACGSDTTILEVNVSSFPTANFGSDVLGGCAELIVNFTDFSTSNTTEWFWTFEGGNPATSTLQNPVVSYANAGSYDVSLVARNDVGEDLYELTDYINVEATPSATIEQSIDGNIVDFLAVAQNVDSYEWTFEGIPGVFTEQDPAVSFPADGVYSVTLKVTNACGTSTIVSAVMITAFPDAAFSSDFVSGCAPLKVTFMDESLDDVLEWQWILETEGTPAFTSDQNPILTYTTPGSYKVTLMVFNTVGSDTLEWLNYITVEEKPVASFDYDITGPSVQFTNTSSGAGSISWDFGDTMESSEENPEHTYLTMGDYQVTLIIDNGSNCIDTITREINILVNDLKEEQGFSLDLYPIPARDYVTAEFQVETSTELSYAIVDAVGRVMEQGSLDLKAGNNKFNLASNYASGLYFLRLSDNKTIYLRKFIVDNK